MPSVGVLGVFLFTHSVLDQSKSGLFAQLLFRRSSEKNPVFCSELVVSIRQKLHKGHFKFGFYLFFYAANRIRKLKVTLAPSTSKVFDIKFRDYTGYLKKSKFVSKFSS